MSIFKKESGLIFKDDFSEGVLHSRWTPSPPSFFKVLDNTLNLKHSSNSTMVLFDLPNHTELLLEVEADYKPEMKNDEGGIALWKESCHQIEFLESVSDEGDSSDDHSNWRAHRNGNEWCFYSDRGYGWELYDTANLDANKAGIILKNRQEEGFKDLNVKSVILCKGNKVTVLGVNEGCKVYLCNRDGYMVTGSYVEEGKVGAEVVVPNAHFYGIINVFNIDNELIGSVGPIDIYGGDVYCLGSNIQVLRGGQELAPLQVTDIGTLYGGRLEEEWELFNPNEEAVIFDVTLRIARYLDNVGFDWVDVSLTDEQTNNPSEYGKILKVDKLLPKEKVSFWVRIEKKDLDKLTLDKGMVYIDITHA